MEDTKDSELKRCCSKNILIILGFSFLIAIIALIAVGMTQNKPLPENIKYGVVLDAGSSHTSIYIYAWPAEKENDTGVVRQLDECTVKGPGISKQAEYLDDLEMYMSECMEKAMHVIPQSHHQDTPVYLGATAGMRLLSAENRTQARIIMDKVTHTLNKFPFDLRGARIITGEEEGAYGWITINYLMGEFTQKSSWFNFNTDENSFETSGALDLGGASTQITFQPFLNDTYESPKNMLYFYLYGKYYSVYTHSFLCYGKDQALLQKLAKGIQGTNGILYDPCFHDGYERVMNMSDIFKTSCTQKFYMAYPFNQIKIIGAGNYDKCYASLHELFNTSFCFYSSCSFNGVYLPKLKGNFGAFSAFYYVLEFLNFTSSEVPNKDTLANILREFCSRPWNELKKQYKNIKENYLSEYCFAGTYILTLLHKGYHFTMDTWNRVHFMDKIQNSSVGWSLGYMLNLTNMIPAEQPVSRPLSNSTYVFLMVFFSLILVVVVILALLIFHKPSYIWKDIA
ncbi:ectonucleoside triphosphate diphosphohydrolase 1 [Erinaceus europaeus]|uniref:Ectonucleoside triphosphate diphosphohydrolase 1 n=1 Tax=Erinaceus europaeus TaxID=9365 RepID=A0ABM3XJR9_ERIEU|nr:ectonucleoside triphosphate diphosphohydrolase 1 [Erinaceus europaeus]